MKKILACIREFKRPTIITPILIVGEVAMECLIPYIISLLVGYLQNPTGIDATTGQAVAFPWMTQSFIDRFGASLDGKPVLGVILSYAAILAVMAVVSLTFGAVAGATCAKASAGFARNLRHDMYANIQRFSFENIDKFSSSSLVTRMTTDVANVQMSFMMVIRTAVRSPLMLIFSIVMSFIMGGPLAFLFVVVVPVLVFGLLMIAKFAMPMFRRVFRKYDRLNESVEENIRGMRVVKSFVREEHEKKKFDDAADDVRRDFTKAERIVAWNSPLMQVCLYFNMVAVLLLGSALILKVFDGNLSFLNGYNLNFGTLSATLTYGMQTLMSLMMLSMIYVMLTMSMESAKRICEVLDECPDMVEAKNPVNVISDGSVDFDAVNFKYSQKSKKNSLEDVNLHIRSGMTVGIIGGTGSGKSSLVQLIPRLYDATEGSVRVGGRNVKDYGIEALREEVAMVLQKNLLFSGTIKENLRWGNPNATDEELVTACKLAQAHDFVSSFPDGYDTRIEQGGTNVSGGQKQRLCIARALLKKPKILILDDSTSAVDTKTDALIRAGFREYIPETTKIIIAQRIASVQDADLIVVMDNGRIESQGTHEELLQRSVIYREVYEQQVNGGEEHE